MRMTASPAGLGRRKAELEHLRELSERARVAFGAARDAFLRLEAAHREERTGTEENAMFLAKVARFRKAAAAVHEAAMRLREDGRRPDE